MMRALAQFIMRGRWQAATVALLGSWFPIVTPATVGLVGLRLGAADGFIVLLWAVLPAVVALWASDIGALMAYSTIAVMLVVLVSAVYLRVSMSWARTLMVLVACSTLAAVGLALLVPDLAASLTETLGELAAAPESTVTATETPAATPLMAQWSQKATAGVLAYLVALSSLMALLVGRWWQALLYNPGGFQAELHNVRLTPVPALVCAVAAAYCLAVDEYQVWANVFSLPLVLAGIGLVHCAVKHYRLGVITLAVFYVALVLIYPALLLVAALAFADVWLNLRNRLKSTQ